jgi:rhombotail lipoprotein
MGGIVEIRIILLLLTAALSGCVVFDRFGCTGCSAQSHRSSSLVDFLYPGKAPPVENTVPELRVPLRVGLAFLPSPVNSAPGPDAAQREQLMASIRKRFASRKFVAEIVVIPDYYLKNQRGFEGLQGVQRLYSVDLMALVSYDQVTHLQDNKWSLGYLTIVGAYALKGSHHDVSTLVDLAVIDPATRSLVLRAGGTDTRRGNTTLVDRQREVRNSESESFTLATEQMIANFDSALTQFEADVKAGKANVRIVKRNQVASIGGGGGATGMYGVAALCLLLALQLTRKRRDPALSRARD